MLNDKSLLFGQNFIYRLFFFSHIKSISGRGEIELFSEEAFDLRNTLKVRNLCGNVSKLGPFYETFFSSIFISFVGRFLARNLSICKIRFLEIARKIYIVNICKRNKEVFNQSRIRNFLPLSFKRISCVILNNHSMVSLF